MGRKSRKKKEQSVIKQTNVSVPVLNKPRNNKLKFQLSFFLGILAFILYANTLKHDYAFDDALVITENSIVQKGAAAIPEILQTNYVAGRNHSTSTMYRPFTLSMIAIEQSLSPDDPHLSHWMNCLFFAFTVMLLFVVLCRIFVNQPLLIPLMATLLFVVHPIHTEVVANIKSRDELMALFCCLFSFLFLFRYMDHKKTAPLIMAGVFYFSALMFKETAVPMLLIFPLLLYFFTDANKKDFFKVIITMVVILAIQLTIRSNVLEHQTGYSSAFLKIHNSLVDTDGFGEKSATIMMLLGRYLLLLFFPHPLSSDYSYNQIPLVQWNSPWPIISLLIHAGLIMVCILRFRKKEAWVFGILFYLVSMVLFSNIFVMIGAMIGERFLYTASLGFCIAIVSLLTAAVKNKKAFPSGNFFSAISYYKIPVLIIIVAAIAGSLKTIARNADWKNNSTLFAADIKNAPESAAMNFRYGDDIYVSRALPQKDTILKKRIIDTAMIYLNKAIAIYPDYGDAYSQRGQANFRSGRIAEAITDYKRSIGYKAAGWNVYNNLGVIYGQKNMLDSAIDCFTRAGKIDSNETAPLKNLGNALELKQDFAGAIRIYQRVLLLNDNKDAALQKEIYSYLADCYFNSGDTIESKRYRDRGK